MRWIVVIVCLFGGYLGTFAQKIRYGAELDTVYMLIGDQQRLTFKASGEEYFNVRFPKFEGKEIIKGVEIIAGPKRDSVKDKSGAWYFQESYVITSFDSGMYVLPEFQIQVGVEGFNSVYRTEPLHLYVNTFQIDEEGQYFDIVMPHHAAWSFEEVLPYLLYVLGGLLLAALIVWLFIKYKRKEPLFKVEKERIPPYVKAKGDLERLSGEKVWQAGHVKEYYSRLTDIVRVYIDEELQVPAMELTSIEIMQALSSHKYVESADRECLAELLETADFVKFAKMMPLPDSNDRSLKIAYDFLEHIYSKIKEEERVLQEQKEKERNENND